MEATGMTGLETDGQFENIACADDHHDHRHNGIEGSFSYQLEATLDFNKELKARRKASPAKNRKTTFAQLCANVLVWPF